MDGGPDPDCRRGMLWEESRQNLDCLAYYRTLIRIRHEYPVLTKGLITAQYADEEKGILYMERRLEEKHVIVVFHAGKGNVTLPEREGLGYRVMEGWKNLINGREFSGILGDYEAAVLAR